SGHRLFLAARSGRDRLSVRHSLVFALQPPRPQPLRRLRPAVRAAGNTLGDAIEGRSAAGIRLSCPLDDLARHSRCLHHVWRRRRAAVAAGEQQDRVWLSPDPDITDQPAALLLGGGAGGDPERTAVGVAAAGPAGAALPDAAPGLPAPL